MPFAALARRLTAAAIVASASLAPMVLASTPAAAAVCPDAGGAVIAEAAAPVGSEIAITGHGFGHSLGMSQYGAQGAARLGCTYDTILGTYYAGSVLEQRVMPEEMKVWMLVNGTSATVKAVTGDVTWSLPSCTVNCLPLQPQGATWRMQVDAAKTTFELVDVTTGTSLWTGAGRGDTVTAAHEGTVVEVNSFRGTTPYLDRELRAGELRFTVDSYGLDAVEAIGGGFVPELGKTLSAMDRYLWGLAEVPLSWTRDANEALRAQTVAARTYAYGKFLTGTTTLYPTQTHQQYNGYAKEREDTLYKDQYARNFRWIEAVSSTNGQVLIDPVGTPVETFFTSSTGGQREDIRYVWGGKQVSYLGALDDSRWDAASSGGTYRSWARGFTKADVADRLGFDTIGDIRTPEYQAVDRLAGVTVTGLIDGVLTTRVVPAYDLKTALNMPSPSFQVTVAGPDLTPTKASAPAIGTASAGVLGGTVTAVATWKAPVANGGTNLTGYRLTMTRYSDAGGVLATTTSALLPATTLRYEPTLVAGKYRFKVRAVNGVGLSDFSAESGLVLAR